MTSCQPQGKRNASWFLALFWFIISLLSSCCRVNLEKKNLTRWQSSGSNDFEINDLNSAEVRVNGKMWSQHTQPSGRIYSSVRGKGKGSAAPARTWEFCGHQPGDRQTLPTLSVGTQLTFYKDSTSRQKKVCSSVSQYCNEIPVISHLT